VSAASNPTPATPERDSFLPPRGALWVFGYGSLMWDAGFAYRVAQPALLHGYHRAFCVYSQRFRGTEQNPGLVLGLNPGGACRGMAFQIAARDVRCALDDLWVREMPRRTYLPRMLSVRMARGVVRALVFVADPSHYAYAGKLALERTARLIAVAHGLRGPNADYLHHTVRHLRDLGVRDRALERLYARVGELQAQDRCR
jgi:glutathione-specific gamma-glutamylcyclotransferase